MFLIYKILLIKLLSFYHRILRTFWRTWLTHILFRIILFEIIILSNSILILIFMKDILLILLLLLLNFWFIFKWLFLTFWRFRLDFFQIIWIEYISISFYEFFCSISSPSSLNSNSHHLKLISSKIINIFFDYVLNFLIL
jgi:hypothetical protein